MVNRRCYTYIHFCTCTRTAIVEDTLWWLTTVTCASMMHVAGRQLLSFQIVCIAGNEAEKLAMRGLLVASITIQSGHVTDIYNCQGQ